MKTAPSKEKLVARIVNSRCVLAVRDLDASTRYYMDVLGFSRDPIDAEGWSFLTRDNFRVMLGECPNERSASDLGDHSYFAYWNIDGVDRFFQEVAARGALVTSEPTDKPWGLREFVLRTPDGHRVTCGEPVRKKDVPGYLEESNKPMNAGAKVSIETAEHYAWGTGCDGWHFVNQPDLSVIRERMPVGSEEVRHLHNRARQFFFVLAGTAVLEFDGATYELQRGEGLEVPPSVPHQIFNRGGEPLDLLIVSQPHSHGDRVPA